MPTSPPRRRRLLRAVTTVSLGSALVLGGGNALVPTAALGSAPAATQAPAVDGSAAGGAVIVWLKNQFSSLNLHTQGRQRTAAVHADQASVVASIKSHGGTQITSLLTVNAVAAHLSAAEVNRLRSNPTVKQIVPDSTVTLGDDSSVAPAAAPSVPATDPGFPTASQCPSDPSKPILEPEALSDLHASTDDPNAPDMANSIATGKGVIVAISGMNSLAGNPNFQRADSSHVVVNAPSYTADNSNDEAYGDASSVAAQGTVVYDMSKSLPLAGLPANCNYIIRGDAPGASLVDSTQIDTPPSPSVLGDVTESASALIAGLDDAAITNHADIISESYGGSEARIPAVAHAANDAAVAAGVTVVVSAGDSGNSGTLNPIAADPLVIGAAAVDNFRLVADAHGYDTWVDNNMAGISGGGTGPTNKMPDLSAPGYFGEASCSVTGSGCPKTYPTEAFRGTSEAAPLIAGGAADVIQAYRDSHGGTSPTPALVKDLLVSTASDIDSPADQQGGGLMNIYAAVVAAQQMPGSTDSSGPGDSPGLVASTSSPDVSQLALSGQGATSVATSVNVYNTNSAPVTVTGTYRSIGTYNQLGSTVTENVSAPAAGTPIPPEGATAALPIQFTVPSGLDRLDVKMIWPDPTNDNVLCYALFDPQGRLEQLTYDDGAAGRSGAIGSVPNIQDGQVANPQAGVWTARFLWSGVDQDLALAPATPGTYTGPMSFGVWGENWVTSPASAPVVIPADSSMTIPLSVPLPTAPGDHPETVQFTGDDGALASVPIARRTLIPPLGGNFSTVITSTVGRAIGQVSTFDYVVPAGRKSLTVAFHTADASADNKFTFFLVDPNGKTAATTTTPVTINGTATNAATLNAFNPIAGTWEIDIELTLTTSGKEFTQTVFGEVQSNAAATQQVETTITQQGALIMSVPDAAPVVLPTPTLSADGLSLTTSGDMNPVTITDTRQSSPGWTASGQVTGFTALNGVGTIPATDLGWTPTLIDAAPTEVVNLGPVVAPGVGLGTAAVLASAAAGHSNGTAHVGAGLTLNAPTSTALGTYSATLTLTAI